MLQEAGFSSHNSRLCFLEKNSKVQPKKRSQKKGTAKCTVKMVFRRQLVKFCQN